MGLKKTVADLICSPIVGKLLAAIFNKRIPSIKNPGFRFSVPIEYSSPVIHASIFWGIYESAEIRLIKKYLKSNLVVIELGGSLGVVSSFIISKLENNASLKVVEANPNLVSSIRTNLNAHNHKKVEYEVLNYALGYNGSSLKMKISSDNTASHVVTGEDKAGDFVEVPCIRLSQLVKENPYVMVCDIEGSEIEFILNESNALKQCRQLFIELHETTYKGEAYTTKDLYHLITNVGFICKAQDGNVYLFEQQ